MEVFRLLHTYQQRSQLIGIHYKTWVALHTQSSMLFLSAKKDTTIETKVMAIVRQRITDAQTEYDQKASNIDVQCNTDIDAVERRRVEEKEALADKLATSILG